MIPRLQELDIARAVASYLAELWHAPTLDSHPVPAFPSLFSVCPAADIYRELRSYPVPLSSPPATWSDSVRVFETLQGRRVLEAPLWDAAGQPSELYMKVALVDSDAGPDAELWALRVH